MTRTYQDLAETERETFFIGAKAKPPHFKTEKALCDFAMDNLQGMADSISLPPIVGSHREYCIGMRRRGAVPRQHSRSRIDIFLEHPGGMVTIVEAKLPKFGSDLVQAVAQLLYYRTLLQTRHEMHFQDIRLVVLADRIDWSVMATIKENNLSIDCVAVHPEIGWLWGRV